MRTQIIPDAGGGHYLAMFDGGACFASVTLDGGHDVNDLVAALAELKAMTRTCGAISDGGLGDHTCWLPPHPNAPGHVCRACDHHWTAP